MIAAKGGRPVPVKEEKIRRLALFGGTFDPIHNGHVHLALEFARRLRLDRVLLMPTYVPPHKLKENMAPAADRLEMCRLAAQADPVLMVSDLEISRGGASFTADTLEALHGQYPDARLYLITGADMFLTLGTWWRFEDIAAMAVLCAAPRDKSTMEELRVYASQLEKAGATCVIEDIPLMPLSSTDVRQRLAGGKDAGELLPAKVRAYIAQKGLYRADGEGNAAMNRDEQFIEIIRGRLGDKRFRHSLAVAEEAERLARRYGADPAKARTAGILHDILKDADNDALLQIFHDFGILLDSAEQHTPRVWHAHAGALFIDRVLMVDDADIVSAVRYHTTGRAGMALLDKVLFVADMTSADRNYRDVDTMRRLADSSLDEALEYGLRFTIRDLAEKEAPIHPDTLAAYNDLVCRRLDAAAEKARKTV